MPRSRVLTSIAVSALAVALLAGTSAATSARTISARITFSGAYKGHVNWSHVANGRGTQLVTYGCMNWTIPGKSLRYALIFGQAYEQKQTLLLKFDYDAGRLGQPHRFRRPEYAGVVVTSPDLKVYNALDPGEAAITIKLAPNLLGGSFDVRNLRGDSGSRKLNISGSWKCPSVFRRTR